jgi:hypothetical protein
MQLLKLSLASVSIWVKLHNLPMEFWNSTCLSHIASGLGKHICVDSVTMEQLRLGFARVLVEVDVNSEFPKEIELIGLDGAVNKVGIEYPWLPIKCKKCHNFGHATHTCTKLRRQFGFHDEKSQFILNMYQRSNLELVRLINRGHLRVIHGM